MISLMEQRIQLQRIFTSELYTRSRASELHSFIQDEVETVILDFAGIIFLSRSFADEICNVMDDMKDKTFVLINQNEDVQIMMSKVKEGRNRERKRGIENAKMHEFDNLESLSKYMQSI